MVINTKIHCKKCGKTAMKLINAVLKEGVLTREWSCMICGGKQKTARRHEMIQVTTDNYRAAKDEGTVILFCNKEDMAHSFSTVTDMCEFWFKTKKPLAELAEIVQAFGTYQAVQGSMSGGDRVL